jgi:hypothetical protein
MNIATNIATDSCPAVGINALVDSLEYSPVNSRTTDSGQDRRVHTTSGPPSKHSSGHTSDRSSAGPFPPFGRISIFHTNARGVLVDIDRSSTGSGSRDPISGTRRSGRFTAPVDLPEPPPTRPRRVETTEPARASGQPERSEGRQPQPWSGRDRDLHRDRDRDRRRRTSEPSERAVWVCMDCAAYL